MIDLSQLMGSGGASGAAGAASSLMSATPYGAAISAVSSLGQAALADTPTSVTSGSGSFQGGGLTVGSKQVGGKGNSAGATTASASQTPNTGSGTVEQSSASSTQQSQTLLYVIIGAGVALIISVLFIFGRKK
jgi:hypothetical protein